MKKCGHRKKKMIKYRSIFNFFTKTICVNILLISPVKPEFKIHLQFTDTDQLDDVEKKALLDNFKHSMRHVRFLSEKIEIEYASEENGVFAIISKSMKKKPGIDLDLWTPYHTHEYCFDAAKLDSAFDLGHAMHIREHSPSAIDSHFVPIQNSSQKEVRKSRNSRNSRII